MVRKYERREPKKFIEPSVCYVTKELIEKIHQVAIINNSSLSNVHRTALQEYCDKILGGEKSGWEYKLCEDGTRIS